MFINPHIGEGVLSPNETNADALLKRMGELTAELIMHGPSTDDPHWFYLLQDDSDNGDAA